MADTAHVQNINYCKFPMTGLEQRDLHISVYKTVYALRFLAIR